MMLDAALTERALEEVYPAFAEGYRRLMRRIGIIEPPLLTVSERYAKKSPAMALISNDEIVVTNAVARLGDQPTARGILAHETSHILTKKGWSLGDRIELAVNSAPVIRRQRSIELEMDRLATVMLDSPAEMIEMRRAVRAYTVESRRPSNQLGSTTILSRADLALRRWVQGMNYDLLQGSPDEIIHNIRAANLKDKSWLERLVSEYNTAKAPFI